MNGPPPGGLSEPGGGDPERARLVTRALQLSYFSVAWGVVAGTLAIVAGLLAGSLGVLGVGLNTAADVAGSVGLVWRFGVERRDPEAGHRAEARASVVVAVALSSAAVVLTVRSVEALITASHPGTTPLALVSAGLAAVVLAPLGWAKHRVGTRLASNALKGDGTLSEVGAALGVVALAGLLADHYLGWWWADRVAALVVAAVAALEVVRVLRHRP